MTTETKTQCCEQVSDRDSRWPSYHQCSRTATVEREGKPYCKTHDPVERKEKDAKRMEAYWQHWANEYKRRKLERAAPDLLAALQEVVEDGLATNMREWQEKAKAAIERATK